MKIFEIVPTLFSGGGEKLVVELSNELALKRHDVTLVTLYDKSNSSILEESVKTNLVKRIELHKHKGLDLNCYLRLLLLIKKEKPDIVHAHTSAIMYLFIPALFYRSCRYFATKHSEAKREAGKLLAKWSRIIMFKYKLCTPITISEEMEKTFELFYKMSASVIRNGVSEYLHPRIINLHDNKEQIVFLHPASCRPVKNQQLLLEAFTQFAKEYSNVKLYWIGRNDHDSFKKLSCYFSDKIIYGGEVDNVRDYMYDADAMCLSSIMEGLPMSIIEAFSVGCIPLCTPVGGCVNIIQDGINGLLAKDMSIESYVDMLRRFVKKGNSDREKMKVNALASFSEYNIDTVGNSYLELFNSK